MKEQKIFSLAYGTIASIALLIHGYSYSGGVLFTTDSYHYIAASISFNQSYQLIDANGNSFLFWPPLYPTFLSLVSIQIIPWIHLCSNLIIWFTLLLISRKMLFNPYVRLICFIFLVIGVHLLLISTFLWSELLFLLLAIQVVYHLLQSLKSVNHLYLAAFFGFLLCLQRNAGVFLIVGASTWLFISESDHKLRFIKAGIFALFSCSGFLISLSNPT